MKLLDKDLGQKQAAEDTTLSMQGVVHTKLYQDNSMWKCLAESQILFIVLRLGLFDTIHGISHKV